MQALIEAEANASPRREEFAGAFNRGYRGIASTYARCTDNARALSAAFAMKVSRSPARCATCMVEAEC